MDQMSIAPKFQEVRQEARVPPTFPPGLPPPSTISSWCSPMGRTTHLSTRQGLLSLEKYTIMTRSLEEAPPLQSITDLMATICSLALIMLTRPAASPSGPTPIQL